MSKAMAIMPDPRSPLGHKIIVSNMLQHMKHLENSHTQLDTHLKPSFFSLSLSLSLLIIPRLCLAIIGPKKRSCYDDWALSRELPRRTATAKPTIDMSEPHTFAMFPKQPYQTSNFHYIFIVGQNISAGIHNKIDVRSLKWINIAHSSNV